MTKSLVPKRATKSRERTVTYESLIERITHDVNEARHLSARAVNAVMTATYWLVGRHIVEYEQSGAQRAEYGEELLARLSRDLSEKLGRRGFAKSNLYQMRAFYLGHEDIFQTSSGESAKALPTSQKAQKPSAGLPDAQMVQTPPGRSLDLPKGLRRGFAFRGFPCQ